ncbi:Qat anti-phage system TatD family nuclease QatD [Bifidobacterium crudilactis]|uniref:Qat anti-phage system TatD family nuclease QatD n=1 Tax=Bifidobacterium crudilactis TaxID=327277 RepID=UPI002649EC71|nr:Qat anti-phage system TatD family nuclease QatD [Bifidobacterium crudilactis]MDN5972963.1 TatD family hydrolase [Bifidobacterium crudilactis]MDN6210161.1 TatD family hydrolase [Bifidobacterium crudilactis]MDN6424748.1 TatD family hydrolase [Bifidobacterium crudilactis]MDN6458943.1 TatD family hydrolase [Bifidobacterium crudilactis]MDN6467093.1 TatD family hydrolase [Bifidobacterium crudilactis]
MIDFHCHLDLYQSAPAVADESQRRDVGLLSVTTTPSAWGGTTRLAKGRSAIRTAIGLHPQLAGQRKHELVLFDRYLASTLFVGEVGLDGSPECRGFWDDQLEVFDHVLQACSSGGEKVISIHSRRAAKDVLDQLDRYDRIKTPILHWFSGSRSQLKRAVERECWFSVGPAMLAGAKGRDLVAAMPNDKVLLETDGPFAQVRRQGLNPWDITAALGPLAELWGVTAHETRQRIEANERALLALVTDALRRPTN